MNYFSAVVLLAVCTITQINSINRQPKNFLCNNGLYIFNDLVCNGNDNCGDNSDEFLECNRNDCNPGYFACNCNRGRCLPVTARCNRGNDCYDGSDELYCGKDSVLDNCTIQREKYLCDDGLKCIDFMYACDGYCNCFDCSDEKNDCGKRNEFSCNTCSQLCIQTPNGPHCSCNLTYDESNDSCRDIHRCRGNTKCDQKCVMFRNKERCSCDENYQLFHHTNGTSCKSSVSHENILIYSTSNQIKAFNLTDNSSLVVQEKVNCLSLVAAHDYVYCSVIRNNSGYVLKISINEKEMYEVVKSEFRLIYSVSVDWITGNVYFTTNASLSVCTNDGRICTSLKSLSLGDAYFVTLAPRFGLMFWSISSRSEFEEPLILRSAMDGSEERVLLEEDLRYPVSLMADELTERVYWLESEYQFAIKSIQFDGKHKRIWTSQEWTPLKIFSFTLLEKTMFFSARNNIIHNNEKDIIDKNNDSVKYLFAYNPFLQRTKIANPCRKSCGSGGLCLLRPSFPLGLNFTCRFEHIIINNNEDGCKNQTDPSTYNISSKFSLSLETYLVILTAFLFGGLFYCIIQKWISCLGRHVGNFNEPRRTGFGHANHNFNRTWKP